MSLGEYSDDELLEEVKHRGFNIELVDLYIGSKKAKERYVAGKIKIGGVTFDIST